MCIIAVKPEKVRLSREQLQIMWDANPHGAGFMYAHNEEIKVVKGLMTMDDLVTAISKAGPLRKMVLHFRIRTHGAVSPEMTHPFWITKGKLAMVHNGVIRSLTHKTTDQISDTAIFANTLVDNYTDPLVAVKNPFHRELLEAYIGSSKMVFMSGTGETWILNEHLGEWNGNIWYSNQKYKAPTTTTLAEKLNNMSYAEFDAFLSEMKKQIIRYPEQPKPSPPKRSATRAKKPTLHQQSIPGENK